MKPKIHGIGIIGCGVIADIHAQAINQLENGNLISVYSRTEENARKMGETYDVDYHSNWESFINDERIDIVSICTPSGTHLDMGIKAAEAGKNIIVEKPIEVTVERGQKLIDFCKEAGIYMSVIFQSRYLDDVLQARDMIREGKIGKIFHTDAQIKWFRSQEYYDSADWRGTFALDGGGVLINQAIHTIDLLRFLVGEIEYIFGQIDTYTHSGIEGEDNAVSTLRFTNGAMGTIVASTSMTPAQSRRVEIHGDKGTLVLDGDDLWINDKPVSNRADKKKNFSGRR